MPAGSKCSGGGFSQSSRLSSTPELGAAHKPYALGPKDLANFKTVFVEMLSVRLGAGWSPAAAQAWDQAFEEVIIPLMREGGG